MDQEAADLEAAHAEAEASAAVAALAEAHEAVALEDREDLTASDLADLAQDIIIIFTEVGDLDLAITAEEAALADFLALLWLPSLSFLYLWLPSRVCL